MPLHLWPNLTPPPEIPFVGIYSARDASRLVAAIEVVSPGNKDRPQSINSFVNKAEFLLKDGVHLLIVDVISEPARPLRKSLLAHLEIEADVADDRLWISSYCSLPEEDPQPHITVREWARDLAVGDPLPALPIYLIADELWVMVNLESTYQEPLRAGRYQPA